MQLDEERAIRRRARASVLRARASAEQGYRQCMQTVPDQGSTRASDSCLGPSGRECSAFKSRYRDSIGTARQCNRPGARRTMPSITTPSPRAHEDLRQHFSILNTDELDAAGPVGAGDEAGDEGALITRLIRSLVKLTGGGMCELPRDPRRPSPKHAALVWTACGDSTPVRRGLSTRSPYRSGSMARSVRWHDLKCWRTNDPWNRPQHPARNRSPVHDLAAR